MSKIFFKEEQRYKQPRIIYIMMVVILMMVGLFSVVINQMINESRLQPDEPTDLVPLIIVAVFSVVMVLAFLFIFLRMRLITMISDDGILIKYPPVMNKGKFISRTEIEQFEIRNYKPRHEFGGYGVRPRGRLMRRKRSGLAYTAFGNTGVQLYLSGERKILIGTQRADAIVHAINKMMGADKTPE